MLLLTEPWHAVSRHHARSARSDDVYVLNETDDEAGIIDFLSSTQLVLLVILAVLAVVLLAGNLWSGRRRSRSAKEHPSSMQPPRPPVN